MDSSRDTNDEQRAAGAALLARTRKFGESLSSNACCPACLLQLATDYSAHPAALAHARHDLHKFWDECASQLSFSELAVSYIEHISETQRVKLRRARRACQLHKSTPTSADILHDYIEALCACLHFCLSIGKSSAVNRSAKIKRAFENRGGHWPTRREDRFPYSVQLGVKSLLLWCTKLASPYPLLLLSDMLRIAHPLVLFEIIEAPALHDQLLLTAINPRLARYSRAARTAIISQGNLSQVPEHLAHNMEATISLLTSVRDSPDALPNSLILLANGSEAGMFTGLEVVLYGLEKTGDCQSLARKVASLCGALYPFIPPPKLICPSILDYVSNYDTLSIFGVLHGALKTMARNRRICSGPDCTTVAHQTDCDGDAHFLVCGRCQLSRYCSKECQMADWKRGSQAPHKKVCPRLCKILAEASVDMEPAAFEAAVSRLNWEQADLRILSLFTLAIHLLPAEVMLRAGDIHTTLMDGEELSEAATSALTSIEGIKQELGEFRDAPVAAS